MSFQTVDEESEHRLVVVVAIPVSSDPVLDASRLWAPTDNDHAVFVSSFGGTAELTMPRARPGRPAMRAARVGFRGVSETSRAALGWTTGPTTAISHALPLPSNRPPTDKMEAQRFVSSIRASLPSLARMGSRQTRRGRGGVDCDRKPSLAWAWVGVSWRALGLAKAGTRPD